MAMLSAWSLAAVLGLGSDQELGQGSALGSGSGGRGVVGRSLFAPVEDTFLDPSSRESNFGREPVLLFGGGRVVLVRFPELGWLDTGGRRVESASVVFTLARGEVPGELSVGALRRFWGEGPGRSLQTQRVGVITPGAGSGWATWRDALSGRGGVRWGEDGARGSASDFARIEGVRVRALGDRRFAVDGLGAAVQEALDNPVERNHGFRFEGGGDFAVFSGEWGAERARLEIAWSSAGSGGGSDLAVVSVEEREGGWSALVENVGSARSGGWSVLGVLPDGRRSSSEPMGALGPGERAWVRLSGPLSGESGDSRRSVLTARVLGEGTGEARNDALSVAVGGLAVGFAGAESDGKTVLRLQRAVSQVNGEVLAHSRFGAYPEGSKERVRLVLGDGADVRVDLAGVDVGTEGAWGLARRVARALTPLGAGFWRVGPGGWAGAGWGVDTRDDGLRLSMLELPALGWPLEGTVAVPLWETGLLSLPEVAWLDSNIGKRGAERSGFWERMAPGLIVRVADALGSPLRGAVVEVFATEGGRIVEPALGRDDTGDAGLVVFDRRDASTRRSLPLIERVAADGSNSWIVLRATRAGESADFWVSAFDLLGWTLRGNGTAPSVEARFVLPFARLDLGQELARGRVVADGAGSFPAVLASLVDGDLVTGAVLGPGQWVEVDLGRDRTFGEVRLAWSGVPGGVEIGAYKTGQRPEDSLRWFRSTDHGAYARVAGRRVGDGVMEVRYLGLGLQGRYVRIWNRGREAVDLREVRVTPVILGGGG